LSPSPALPRVQRIPDRQCTPHTANPSPPVAGPPVVIVVSTQRISHLANGKILQMADASGQLFTYNRVDGMQACPRTREVDGTFGFGPENDSVTEQRGETGRQSSNGDIVGVCT
jgi:hypothetical protein